ncbi:MAG: hypothetical protein AAFX99_20540 [Myxococcota bacterium]
MPKIPSRITLDKAVPRASRFLSALAQRSDIHSVMATSGGYSALHHTRGINLMVRAMGTVPAAPPPSDDTNEALRDAIAQCSTLDDTVIAKLAAALEYAHPEVYAFMSASLEPGEGLQAVANLQLIATRLRALKDDPAPVGGTDVLKAATQALAEYGLDQARIDALEALAQQASGVPEQAAPGIQGVLSKEEIEQARIALYYWHKGWARIARSIITRRDWLIRLGLATRRKTASGETIIEYLDDDDDLTTDDDITEEDA